MVHVHVTIFFVTKFRAGSIHKCCRQPANTVELPTVFGMFSTVFAGCLQHLWIEQALNLVTKNIVTCTCTMLGQLITEFSRSSR